MERIRIPQPPPPIILHLILKKKWFDMIASGAKQEEYRDITTYWEKRLVGKPFDVVRFRNGYGKDAPTMEFEFLRVRVGIGHERLGYNNSGRRPVFVYIIDLGKRLK